MTEIRLATRRDGKQLEDFLERTNSEDGPNKTFRGLAQIIKHPPRDNFVACIALEGKEIVGALLAGPAGNLISSNAYLTQAQRDVCAARITEIAWIVVDPEARRTGIGSSLLGYAEQEIKKKNGFALLFFDPEKEELSKFYEENGYIIIERGHGIAVQPPGIMGPIGHIAPYQAAYKTFKPHIYVRVFKDCHVIYGAFDD